MNWRRRLLRLWVIASACWIILVGGVTYQEVWISRQVAMEQTACADARGANPALGNPFDCFDSQVKLIPLGPTLARYAVLAIVPVVGTFALGVAGAWVISGFRQMRS